ncbi:hypothetical protein DL766_010040 [Monosporascus sp. MC13-8B]|uniref:Uncharacterized protein n=1 Tax=Monosporascus cannonballus TaxID=155416 RepID=A0ABY0H1N0_9PEZI|nr:hypothetical protein DL763_009798 [Monosporascus cannonballus]RYO79541.1 hypothetical protein DL762_008133 [Monosporascus cannonballus]RYP11514.1 hypothetical protein DL766_010040 [Monosporascus sp. MC13-8B]
MSLRQTLDEVARQDDGGDMDHDQRARLHREWNKFIEAYSICRLTVDGDIFMALEGIAREVSDCTGDGLVMGLWRSQLPRQSPVPPYPTTGMACSHMELGGDETSGLVMEKGTPS